VPGSTTFIAVASAEDPRVSEARLEYAQRLYRTLGFREIAAYYEIPVPGTRYLERDLRQTT